MGFKKHLNLANYALDSVFLYKTRTIAVVSSLALALMVLGSVAFLSNGLEREAELSTAFAPDITAQILQAGRQTLVHLSDFQNLPFSGDITVVPRVWGYISYESKIITLMGIDSARMPIPEEINFIVKAGHFLREADTSSIMVGDVLADHLGLMVGMKLTLLNQEQESYDYTVTGIFTSDVRLYTADLILMNIGDARTFFSIDEGYSSDLCIYVKNSALTRIVAQKLVDIVPNIRVLTREILKDSLLSAYGARSGFVSVVWYILLLAVILVAWNQSSTLSSESRKEVGLLKALGFNTLDVIEVKLTESIILGVTSASLGILLSLIYTLYFKAPILREFLLAWAQAYPEFPLPIYVKSGTVVVLYLIAVFPLLAGSIIPAWLSAVTEPDTAIRGI